MKRSGTGMVVGLFVAGLALAGPASATVRIQERAKNLGYPAGGCAYCHIFDSDHMEAKARELGISPRQCMVCHGAKLPKSGMDILNDRGKWLANEKMRRKEPVDPIWLKGYAEKK